MDLCRTLRCQTATEKTLQDALEPLLNANFSTVQREAKLSPREHVDFLVEEHWVVEVKVGGSWMAVTRQIQRYLDHESVHGLVLVTTRRQHFQVPQSLRGKPVAVAWLSPF